MQNFVRVEQVARAPDDEILWCGHLIGVVIEIVIKLVTAGKERRVPAVGIVVNGDARIQVCDEKRRRVDRTFAAIGAVAMLGEIDMPFDTDLHGRSRSEL